VQGVIPRIFPRRRSRQGKGETDHVNNSERKNKKQKRKKRKKVGSRSIGFPTIEIENQNPISN